VPRVNRTGKMPMTRDTSLAGSKLEQLGLTVIRGRLWSPNIYKNARRAGLGMDAAWKTSFVQ
jgi:hypothetical protein